MIVGVPHGPARSMSLGFFAGRRVDQSAVTVGPFLPRVEFTHLRTGNDKAIISQCWRNQQIDGPSDRLVHKTRVVLVEEKHAVPLKNVKYLDFGSEIWRGKKEIRSCKIQVETLLKGFVLSLS